MARHKTNKYTIEVRREGSDIIVLTVTSVMTYVMSDADAWEKMQDTLARKYKLSQDDIAEVKRLFDAASSIGLDMEDHEEEYRAAEAAGDVIIDDTPPPF
jgi:predicted DsbA family dithiol-disulfide isomerase